MWNGLLNFYHHLSPVWHWVAATVTILTAIVAKGHPVVKEYFELKKLALENANLPKEREKTALEVEKLKKESSPIVTPTTEEIIKFNRVTSEICKKILAESNHQLFSAPFGEAINWVSLIADTVTLFIAVTLDRAAYRLKLMFSR